MQISSFLSSFLLVLALIDCSHGFCPQVALPITRPTKSQLSLSINAAEVIGLLVAGFAGWLYVDGADDRARSKMRQEQEAILQAYQEERARKAYIEPKEYWTEEELAPYNGEQDDEGPILLAADGLVFNVYKGRNFYGPGGEYHLFAGRDATRFLAKTITEEETEEEKRKPLTMGERAALAGWIFTLKNKYQVVGKLEGFDPTTTSMKEGVKNTWKDPRLS
jgi:membrane-associated progesterone receptor component